MTFGQWVLVFQLVLVVVNVVPLLVALGWELCRTAADDREVSDA